ncbi:Fe-S-cluster oxidoreductase [Klebsiella pneumoniae]|uniref:Fe-S-cluster oxidoreductase n=1 Tax=Klebsiella pneumoniae TaxID=573 RepID=A0A939NRJ4_KLEPN|nr:Fe-S-cluster oxidoreductase [Klebsiella pneumoniae]
MPQGKPANVRCVQLSNDNLCNIFGSELRPKVCGNLQPSPDMCSTDRDAAITYLLHRVQHGTIGICRTLLVSI